MTGLQPLAATTTVDSPLPPPTCGVPPPAVGFPPPALGVPPPICGAPPPNELARSVSAEPLLSALIARSWKCVTWA